MVFMVPNAFNIIYCWHTLYMIQTIVQLEVRFHKNHVIGLRYLPSSFLSIRYQFIQNSFRLGLLNEN